MRKSDQREKASAVPDTLALEMPEQHDLERLLAEAMSRGGDFAEVFVERKAITGIRLEDDLIRSAEGGLSRGAGVRVISGERVGYAYTDDLDPRRLREVAAAAAHIAGEPGEPGSVSLTRREPPSYSPVREMPDTVPVSRKAALLMAGNDVARGFDPRVTQVMGAFGDSVGEVLVANTEGLLVRNRRTMCRLYFHVVAEDGSGRQTGTCGGGGRVGFDFYDSFTPEDAAREAARQAVAQLGAMEAPAGEQTVVLSNGWSGVLLHEAVGHGLEADFIRKGSSLYSGRLGEKVASELCTVIDDGTIPHKRGTIDIDDEGEAGERTVLIERGVLKGFLYDRLNAGIMGARSTGNGRRQSFRHYPLPRMTNTFLEAGEHDPDEIIRSVTRGLYAKMLGGGQVDISNGNFVFEVREGYLIEGGRITEPVKNATLIGVGPEVLGRISMVGSDLDLDPGTGTCGKDGQSVPTGVGMPTVRIDGVTVGGTRI